MVFCSVISDDVSCLVCGLWLWLIFWLVGFGRVLLCDLRWCEMFDWLTLWKRESEIRLEKKGSKKRHFFETHCLFQICRASWSLVKRALFQAWNTRPSAINLLNKPIFVRFILIQNWKMNQKMRFLKACKMSLTFDTFSIWMYSQAIFELEKQALTKPAFWTRFALIFEYFPCFFKLCIWDFKSPPSSYFKSQKSSFYKTEKEYTVVKRTVRFKKMTHFWPLFFKPYFRLAFS